MDSLVKLLAIEVPENTKLQSAELSFRGLLPWWLAVLLLIGIAAGVFYLYRLEKGTLGWPRRIVAGLLRLGLIALLLLLLFRPVLLTEFQGERARGIVVLLDNSQSMELRDNRLSEADKARVAIAKGLLPATTRLADVKSQAALPFQTPLDPPRAELVKWVLTHADLKLLAGLEKHGPLRPYLFGYGLHGTSEQDEQSSDKIADQTKADQAKDKAPTKPESVQTEPKASKAKDKTPSTEPKASKAKDKTPSERLLESFKANEARTGLGDAVSEILQRKDGDMPAAMFVLTDGQDNASKLTLQEAALECARYKVPLHIYGVGTAEGGSLRLKEVQAPDTIFVDDTLTVPLRWRAQGFKKGALEISLTLGGKEMVKKDLPLLTGEDLRESLSFTVPKGKDKEENLDLVATIQLKGNDKFKDKITRPLRVVDKKIKVLYIEHAARFTFQFLQASMLRDRRIDASFLLVQADPKVAQTAPFIPAFPATREKFIDAKYNVIILGDVAASYLGKEHMEWIKEFVQNRGGLIVIAGRNHMPASYDKTPLAEVFPVEFEPKKFALDSELRTQEYPVTLTDVGQRVDMLFFAETAEENLKEWARLPGFHWHYPITKLRPGALSLLVNPRAKMGEQPMPVLATQFYGKGHVLFMTSDETWRWRFNEADKITNRFWGQLVYQLGLPSLLGETSKRVHMALERSEAVLNKEGSIFVRLLDKEFNPRKDPQVEAILEYTDAKPGQEKTRKITLQPIPGRDGEYRALLAHDQPGRWKVIVSNPDPTSFEFRVELPPRHELEESGLAEKALRDMAELSQGAYYREEDLHKVVSDVQPQKTTFTRRQEVILWNPLALVLFLVLITGEWLVRKFSNLS